MRRRRLREATRLVKIAARLLAGRRFWVVPLLPLLWPATQAVFLLLGWRDETYSSIQVQNGLIGGPLAVLAGFLGLRIIAGEIDRRTLEIVYTVPGGAWRVWTAKLIAAVGLIVASEAALALVAWAFFTRYPVEALYGALQAAVFYLVLSMTLAAWTRSEATGGMLLAGILLFNSVLRGNDGVSFRVSPFWNTAAALESNDVADVVAWTVQNRVGFVLAIAAVIALGYVRAERRERLLSG